MTLILFLFKELMKNVLLQRDITIYLIGGYHRVHFDFVYLNKRKTLTTFFCTLLLTQSLKGYVPIPLLPVIPWKPLTDRETILKVVLSTYFSYQR